MHRTVVAIAGLLAAASVLAQADDPMKSPQCRQAMEALERQEAQAASAPRADRQPLEAARRQAAKVCLGGRGDRPPPSAHFVQPGPAVPSTTSRPPPTAAPAAPPATPAAPPAAPAPVRAAPVVTGCDDAGCWTSDGARVQRLGPNLILGPRGVCTVNGVTVSCQ